MAVDIGDALAGFGWEFVSSFFDWAWYIALAIGIAVGIYGIVWFYSFNVKVTYYEPVGGIRLARKEGETDQMYEARMKKELEGIYLSKPKKDRGKYTKWRGVQYFKLLYAFKKTKPIPYELRYPDGVFLIRADKDLFIPIERPQLGDKGAIMAQLSDRHDINFWDMLLTDEINVKYRDEDREKKLMVLFVVIVVGGLLLYGVVLWLSYLTATKQINEVGKLTGAIDQLSQRFTGGNAPG